MPLSIGDLNWTQDSEFVKIIVKLDNAVPIKSLDIFTHSEYIKLNAPPFYRELFLHKPIDAGKSKCKIKDRCVFFELMKIEKEPWDQLECTLPDKPQKLLRKAQIVQEAQEQTQKDLNDKQQRKEDTKRKEMLTEIDRQNEERKRQERKVELIREDVVEIVQEQRKVLKPPLKESPGIRKSGAISVTFTERVFPTPQRESQTNVEKSWMDSQLAMKKSVGFVDENLREEERDPVWLLAKGNEFFSHGNYLGAISAYSTGIKLDPKSIQLHLNRAGAQFREGNYIRCAEDCSKALQLLDNDVDGDKSQKKMRIQCLARRGAALCKMGLIREGWGELHAAWQLDKSNDSLKQDLDEISKRLAVAL